MGSIGKDAAAGFSRISAALDQAVAEETLAAAKEVAQGQILDLDNDWRKMAENYAMNTGFMHTPLGKDVMGSEATISTMTTGELESAVKLMNNTGLVIAAVGDVDHDALCKQVEERFGNLWSNGGLKPASLFTGSSYSHRFDSTNFGITSAIHHVPPPNHKFGMEMEVGSQIIGSYDPKKAGNQFSSINLRGRFGHRGATHGMPAGVPGMYPAGHSWEVEYLDTDYEVYGGNAVL